MTKRFNLTLLSLLFISISFTQSIRYQNTLRGGLTVATNSLRLSETTYPNTAPEQGVIFSSSSDLILPQGSKIVKAILYVETFAQARIEKVKFRVPNSINTSLTSNSTGFLGNPISKGGSAAQFIIDVTHLMPTDGFVSTVVPGGDPTGKGSYSVADFEPRLMDNNGCGWTLFVVYENALSPIRNVIIADVCNDFSGFIFPGFPVSSTVEFTNIIVPTSGTFNSMLISTGTYGDAGFPDELTLTTSSTNLAKLNDPISKSTNDFLNSTIGITLPTNVSTDGVVGFESGNFMARNPFDNFIGGTKGSSYFYDCDVISLTGKINVSAVPIKITLTNRATSTVKSDALGVGAYGLTVDQETQVALTSSSSPNTINCGEITTYTYTIDNTGSGAKNQTNIQFTNNLPSGLVVASPNGVTITGGSGGTLTAVPGSTVVSLSNLSLAVGEKATVTVAVTNAVGKFNSSCSSNSSAFTNSSSNFVTSSNVIVSPTISHCTVVKSGVTFNKLENSLCKGANPTFVLPTKSVEGINGTWTPSTINNQTTTTYSFTTNELVGCSVAFTHTILVKDSITPVFTSIKTLICQGDTVSKLPKRSDDFLDGSWFPSNLNNQRTETYTFTPNSGTCARQGVKTIEVKALPISLSGNFETDCLTHQASVKADVVGTAPYTYSWYNLDNELISTLPSINGLNAGWYKIRVLDKSACSTDTLFEVKNTSNLTITSTVQDEKCGDKSGFIQAVVSGGTGDLNYTWNNQDMYGLTNNNLGAGSYWLRVRDSLGCESTALFTIKNIGSPKVKLIAYPSECGASTGAIECEVSGTNNCEYALNNGAYTTNNIFNNLSYGSYILTIKSADGCITIDSAVVSNGLNLNVKIETSPANCKANNGTAEIVLNGTNNYSFKWNTGETVANLSSLSEGMVYCDISDSNGCKQRLTGFIERLAMLQHHHYPIQYDACNGLNTITPSISGGMIPYKFKWIENNVSSMNLSGVPTGTYTLRVTDDFGCVAEEKYTIQPGKFIEVTGFVLIDENTDCKSDIGERAIDFGTIHFENNEYQTASGFFNRKYKLLVLNKPAKYHVKYSVSDSSNVQYLCDSIEINTNGQCEQIDHTILVKPRYSEDFSVELRAGPPRPGFSFFVDVITDSYGMNLEDTVEITLKYDTLLRFSSSKISPIQMSKGQITWKQTVATLPWRKFSVYFKVPTIQEGGTLGKELVYEATLKSQRNEAFMLNNTFVLENQIVGAYDPNAKYVKAQNKRTNGTISPDKTVLDYRIDFQNTGTDTAFTVIVRDTLSPFLDLSTFRFFGASHPHKWKILPNRLLEVTFPNILLVDSNRNEPLSHGWFEYSVSTINGLKQNSVVKNTAYIYFDFNEPIVTNTTLTKVEIMVGINEYNPDGVLIYPNPLISGNLNLDVSQSKLTYSRFILFTTNGQEVFSQPIMDNGKSLFDLSEMASGMYVYHLLSESGEVLTGKLSIVKN